MNEPQQTDDGEQWVKVGNYPSLAQAYDDGLVILAMGESCRVEEADESGKFNLHAEPEPAAKIVRELDSYHQEAAEAAAHPAGTDRPHHSAGWNLAAVWILALLAVFYWQGNDPTLTDRGASSTLEIFDRGEWWRPFTALFLHADIPHLAGNLFGGAVLAALVSKSIGPWRAWPQILACGAAANFLNAWLQYPGPFSSIGASTAVFAALGLLSGLGTAELWRDRSRLAWVRIFAPVLAGIILLGWLGTGGSDRTDVMGHMLGFGTGLAAGASSVLHGRPFRNK